MKYDFLGIDGGNTMASEKWKAPVVVATVIMAMVTACNGLIYFLIRKTYQNSLELTQKSVQLTSRMMEATNRPFVSPLSLSLVQLAPNRI